MHKNNKIFVNNHQNRRRETDEIILRKNRFKFGMSADIVNDRNFLFINIF